MFYVFYVICCFYALALCSSVPPLTIADCRQRGSTCTARRMISGTWSTRSGAASLLDGRCSWTGPTRTPPLTSCSCSSRKCASIRLWISLRHMVGDHMYIVCECGVACLDIVELISFWESLEIREIMLIFSQKLANFLNFQETGYIWKVICWWICVPNFNSISWNWVRFVIFIGRKSFLTPFLWGSFIFTFFRFGWLKKSFTFYFFVLKKLTSKRVVCQANPIFTFSIFLAHLSYDPALLTLLSQ